MSFGNFLKIVRMSANMSQVSLSQSTGIATTLLSRYECNKLNPRPETLEKISVATGVALTTLLDAQKNFLQTGGGDPNCCIQVPIIAKAEDCQFDDFGRVFVSKHLVRLIDFPKEILPVVANSQDLVSVFIEDHSLNQYFPKKSCVLIDTSDHSLENGRFMCLKIKNTVVIRYVAQSDNDGFVLAAADKEKLIPPMRVSAKDFKVIGVVVWKSGCIE